jgi:methylenetetrahydrofolate dehydrogenase (NADP+)/methenyltetrahydrofolate cyclohydrolase
VQSPVPEGLSEEKAFESIHPLKDVDCFHPQNVGLLMLGRPRFLPATPAGVIELLVRYNIKISGQHVVIVGRSSIVGRPLANMLAQKSERGNATVTVCHTGTKGLTYYTKQADIVIAAAGQPGLITGDMLNSNCTVIDVGTNRIPDASAKSGYRLAGDVDFESASKVAAYISPVPGGVGLMTVAMLLKNCVMAAKLQT